MNINQDLISNRYQLIQQIGKGGQGSVYLAISKLRGKEVAIKVIQLNPNNQNDIMQEILGIKSISNNCMPYVACYYDSFYDPSTNQVVIEMEYIKGPTVNVYTQPLRNTQNRELLIKSTKLLLKAMLLGLKFIHSKGLLHNDIKPSNIVIGPNKVPVLVDFGISCFVQDAIKTICTKPYGKVVGSCCETNAGTSIYLPPEVIYNVRYPASDLWSLAATAYEIMTGTNIWNINTLITENNNPWKIFEDVINKLKQGVKPNQLYSGDANLDKIINGFLIYDPTKRLTIDQALSLL